MYQHSVERVMASNEALNRRSLALYERLMENVGVINLAQPETITTAYAVAQEQGLFTLAEEVRKYYFGRVLTTYGVVYVSDACVEDCIFCPAGRWNRNYRPQTMNDKEVVADVLCTMLQGHKRVCVLQSNWSEVAFLRRLEGWLPKVIGACAPLGLEELILNVQTLTEEGYRQIVAVRNAVDPMFMVQVRTFQETYDKKVYEQLIPACGATKHDFWRRRATQETAWKAGVDAVGSGVLFGLSQKPLQELQALVKHVEELLAKGVNVVRVCLPSAHKAGNLKTRIPYVMEVDSPEYQQLSELLYALARLALPEMNWVMSERDPREIRDSLARFATETTVGVRPGVGDNLAAFRVESKGLHFVQTKTYAEVPEEYLMHMKELGYKLDLNLGGMDKILDAIREMSF